MKTCGRHNLESNCTSYSTLLPRHTRANHRPGCWKQLPLPVPHCWQYRRHLESIATVCIMIAGPSLEVCVPRHLSRLWGRSAAVRQPHRVRTGTHLPKHSVGCGKVSCMWPVIRIFCYQGAKGERGLILSLYTVYSQKGAKIREKICIFSIFFGALFVYPDNAGITYFYLHNL